MDVTFLYAPQRLCKTIKQLADGEIEKSAYPLAKNFTSETVEVNNLLDFYKALSSRAVNPKKPCLIKGRLSRPLISESRRNTTNTNDKTQFIVLDPDEAPFSSPEELMRALKLQDISYVVQYSSSYKLKQSKKLSCHIFIMLDRPMAAPALKAWLMQMNLDVQVLRNALTLSNSRAALKWALDITSCQNDRLIYIAEPDFHGMKAPIKPNERILYVKKERDRLDISRLSEKALDVLKKEARTELIRLQTAAGMTPLRNKPRMQGEYLVQHGVAEVGQFEVVDEDDEFVRLNLNGGDSAAYWHYRTDFELLHNFKGEDSVKLKEILPEYYKELINRRKTEEKALKAQRATPSPSNDGDQLLCFRDKHTGSYFNGTYNVGLNKLDLFPAKNERQCEHFMMSHGEVNVDFIPIWERIFDPTTDVVVDFEARTINMWCPSDYIKNARTVKEPKLIDCPIIQKILDSAVGIGPIQDHFLNWLAVLMQHRAKPRTAWVLHGTQGTGKGLLVHNVLAPIFGSKYTPTRMQNELKSDFSSFIEFAMLVFIDEIEAGSLEEGGQLEAKLKYYITEPVVPIRRMRTDSYEVNSYCGWIFGSNKVQPVVIPRNDRRYNVGQFQKKRLEMTLDEVEVELSKELQTFTNYLVSRKADKERAAKPLLTEDRETLMALSENSLEKTANAILTGDLEAMWEAMPDEAMTMAQNQSHSRAVSAAAYIQFVKRALEDAHNKRQTRLTRDELGMIFDWCCESSPKSPNKLTQFLRHQGIVTQRLRNDEGKLCYGIDVTWEFEPAFLKDVYKPPKPQPRARGERALQVVEGRRK